MKKNIFFTNIREKILILVLIVFSLLINQYYGNQGVFPIDSFLHFDTGYRILNGEKPFSDFWTVSGPLVNYIQAIFFYIFGINWSSYVLHASVINALATIFTFFVLKNFGLDKNFCFLYSILFSILAYPSSGTPFVDHHSTFFSLFGVYSLLLAISNKERIYWILIPIFLGLAFLSKQVPAIYIILSILIILSVFSFQNKTWIYIIYIISSSVAFIFIILIFGKFQEIEILSFFNQYIFYPQTIGSERFANFNLNLFAIVDHFKFIFIAIIPLIYFNFKKIISVKKYFRSNEFYTIFILLFLTFSLISHQLLTKNQTFIFFLIPILTGFSHIALKSINFKFKNFIYIIIIFICVFAVLKYHFRFNENRKFHELANVDFRLSKSAEVIDKKLKRLNWITSEFDKRPDTEIKKINEIKLHLKEEKRSKMLITNYTFFSVILEENLFSPSWAFAGDGTTHPMKGNKYAENYKKLMINIIKKNKIQVIYIAGSLEDEHIYNYISKNCFKKHLVTDHLKRFELIKCKEISG